MKIQNIQNLVLGRKIKFTPRINNFYHTKPLNNDVLEISFKNKNKVTKPLNIGYDSASKIVSNLATATSGHRASWGSETFDKDAVKLIALGVAEYAKENSLINGKPAVIIGGDTRVATRESLPEIKDTLLKQGVDVIYIKDPIPTPLLALTAKTFDLGISILMTASHNPWQDGGFNFITSEGAVAPTSVTGSIAKHIDNIAKRGSYTEDIVPTGVEYKYDPYNLYLNELDSLGLIDFEKIKNSGIKVYYDGLQGTGKYVVPRMLDDFNINYKQVNSKGQTGPNPTEANLKELSKQVKNSDSELKIGLANDGDADRFGIIDENGNFIDPNDVLLLVAHHLINNKNLSGDIVRSQATSQLLEKIGQKYGLKTHETPIGFKYLASDIMNARKEGRDIIVAGEESGGLTTYGYIPEKDGILADFLILDLVAAENKPISEILENVKKDLGYVTYVDNYSKRLKDEETKQYVMNKAKKRLEDAFNGDVDFGYKHKVDIIKTLKTKDNIESYRPEGDGYKFVMTDGSTVLIRKSGTEPLTRFYIEATGSNSTEAKENALYLKEYVEEELSEKK